MSRSKTVPLKVPNVLVDEDRLARLLEATHMPNLNALIVNQLRYAYLHGQPHYAGAEWANAPIREQDAIDDEVTRAFDANESLAGSYFSHLVRECVEELGLQIERPEHKVAAIMARKLAERGGKPR